MTLGLKEMNLDYSPEQNVTEPVSAQTHGPIDTFGPLSPGEHVASAQKPHEASSRTGTSSSTEQAQTVAQDAIDISPPSGRCLSSPPVSRIWARIEFDWGYTFYVRLDHQGFFHTYPHLGGPYQSLLEADKAIDRHLDERRDPKMFVEQDGVSAFDLVIRRGLYWPDGTSKRRSKSRALEKTHNQVRQLVQALVDKYNDDCYLLGDLAYELKDVSNFQSISEDKSWYYHLNFITNSKAADKLDCGIDNLFFAEVKHLNQGKFAEVFVCCFCIVNPTDKGQHCNGCTILGNVDMKHPDSTVELAAGHLDPRDQFGGFIRVEWSDSEDEDTYLKDTEAELRRMYKGLDDPRVIERLFELPPGVTIVRDCVGVEDQEGTELNINQAF